MEEIEWQAFEYDFEPKSDNWFWAIWIIAIGMAWTSFLFNNFILSILILVAVFSISVFASRPPKRLTFKLFKKGFLIEQKLISFYSLQSFWINEDEKKILLKPQSKTKPLLIIPLNPRQIDNDEIKSYLLTHLEEEELKEPFLKTLLERLI
ncbi:MAG: hypothetical protein V1851_02705 [Patescibacteria group bacterium]